MELNERPKLKLPKTPLEIIFDGVGLLMLVGSIVYLLAVWSSLPVEVPAHYNAVGEVDRWGSKWEIIFLPIISSVLWIGMTVLEKYPHVYNFPRLTKENVRAQYLNGRKMINVLKNVIAILFAYISWNSIYVALGRADSLGAWFLPVFFIVIFVPMIYFYIRSLRL